MNKLVSIDITVLIACLEQNPDTFSLEEQIELWENL